MHQVETNEYCGQDNRDGLAHQRANIGRANQHDSPVGVPFRFKISPKTEQKEQGGEYFRTTAYIVYALAVDRMYGKERHGQPRSPRIAQHSQGNSRQQRNAGKVQAERNEVITPSVIAADGLIHGKATEQ